MMGVRRPTPLTLLAAALLAASVLGESPCQQLSDCNGHGSCTSGTKRCQCFDGYGSDTDRPLIPMAKGDCSERMCKMGRAWMDIPTAADTAHAEQECSGAGLCNRASGICTCFPSYRGDACQRATCGESGCTVNGRCISLRDASLSTKAQPVGPIVVGGYGHSDATTTWDSEMIYMCVCDSSWTVGLASGETQLAEFFGPDCSLRHCPSGDNPMTDADETDCSGKLQSPYNFKTQVSGSGGAAGNLCHHDCAGNGKCDYATGLCACYTGWDGEACATQNTLSVYAG